MNKWIDASQKKRDTDPIHCVYLLWCDVKKEYYVGITEDFESRLKNHKDKELPNHKKLLDNLMLDRAGNMEYYFINCPPQEVCHYKCLNKQKNCGYILDDDRVLNYNYINHYQLAVEAYNNNPNLEVYYYETVRKKYVPDKMEELMKEIEMLKEKNYRLQKIVDERSRLYLLEEKLRNVRKMFEQEFRDFEAEEIL